MWFRLHTKIHHSQDNLNRSDQLHVSTSDWALRARPLHCREVRLRWTALETPATASRRRSLTAPQTLSLGPSGLCPPAQAPETVPPPRLTPPVCRQKPPDRLFHLPLNHSHSLLIQHHGLGHELNAPALAEQILCNGGRPVRLTSRKSRLIVITMVHISFV